MNQEFADDVNRFSRSSRAASERLPDVPSRMSAAARTIVVVLAALLVAPSHAQALRLWGDDASGQLSGAPAGDFRAIAGGSINGVALSKDGKPVLWGNGPIGPLAIDEALLAEKFHGITLGRDDAVLIRADGTLAGFGRSPAIRSVPAGHFHAVAVSAVHAVAIARDGTLTTWGTDSPQGVLNWPRGGPFKEVSARVLYALALHADGTLFGWGHQAHGTNVLEGWVPTPADPAILYVPGESFKAIAAGNVHALAIRQDGTLMGWGNAAGGALAAPTHVRFKAVAAGWGFSIGLTTDGVLWGWGTPMKSPYAAHGWTFASQGWTRHEDTQLYYVPDERFKEIAAAAFHVMALTASP